MEAKRGMKAKTIKAVLRKKIDAWLQSIEDEQLKKLCHDEAIVTGGSIASMLLGEKVSDFDIYFRNKETVQKVAQYYLDKFKSNNPNLNREMFVDVGKDIRGEDRVRVVVKSDGVESEDPTQTYQNLGQRPPEEAGDYTSEIYDDIGDIQDLVDEITDEVNECDNKKDYRPIFLSTNAITLSGKIQLILRFFGDPETIHANYDFVHCTNYWESKNSKLVLKAEAMQSLLSRNLIYQGSRYPVASVFRIRKFINRGWRINAGQILKMIMQINELNLNDYNVLEDQLTGVDVAYFIQVLDIVKEKNSDEEKIDSAYLIEIIDRIFGD